MQWSMPRPVLQVVAALIGLIAIGSLALGIATAPSRGRLPGEKTASDSGAAPIDAAEATPLGEERIEGPPPPTPLTDEQKAKLAADKKAKEEADADAKLAAAQPATATPTAPTAPADKVGDLLDSVTPPPDEPPH
jgi:hypothetical protein